MLLELKGRSRWQGASTSLLLLLLLQSVGKHRCRLRLCLLSSGLHSSRVLLFERIEPLLP